MTLPEVTEVFIACGGDFRCWPKADTSSTVTIKTCQKPETALEKSLAPRVEWRKLRFLIWNKTGNKRLVTCFATLLQDLLKSAFYHPRSNLFFNNSGWCRLRKVVVQNLYMLCILPTQGKLVLQQAVEVTPEYNMTPVQFYPITSQYSGNLQWWNM